LFLFRFIVGEILAGKAAGAKRAATLTSAFQQTLTYSCRKKSDVVNTALDDQFFNRRPYAFLVTTSQLFWPLITQFAHSVPKNSIVDL
jgi:hypothetical protein